MSGKMNVRQLSRYLLMEYCVDIDREGIKRFYCGKYIGEYTDTNSYKYTDEDAQKIAKSRLMKNIFRLSQAGKKKDEELETKIENFVKYNSEEALRSILNVELRFDTRRDYFQQILDSCKEYNRNLSQINWGLVHKELVLQQHLIKQGQEEKEKQYYMLFMNELVKRPYPDHLSEQLIGCHANILLSIIFVDRCDPLLVDWLLDDQDDESYFPVLLKSKGFSEEVIDSVKEEFRNGISEDKYIDIYFKYIEENYIKIHACAAYLVDKYESDRIDLWDADRLTIKKIATEMFGLALPNFVSSPQR